MTTMDYGVTGVKRQSIRKGNPRNFIANILEKNPDISDEDIREKVKAAVLKNEDYLDAIVEFWVARERRNLTRQPYQPRSPEHQATIAQTVTENVERLKTNIVKMKFLDMIVPYYNKTARECTCGELAKLGGGIAILSKCGKPHERLGDVITDAAAKKLFERGLKQA